MRLKQNLSKEDREHKGLGFGAPQQKKTSTSIHPKGKQVKSNPSAQSKSTEPSLEDRAALTIQCFVRQLLAKRTREQKRKEKKEYEDLMDRLEKEAFVALVRREQEEAERERMKEEEERRKKKEEQRLRKRLLEAAFDGEEEEILAVLREVTERDTKQGVGFDEAGKRLRALSQLRMINCTDANGNTPLSEAAGGGNPEVITMLLERGADVNTQGAFGRTPIYRAAFGGHLRAVQTLLQFGADPRTHADDGSTPEQVASGEAIIQTLQSWDVNVTDSMLKKMEAERERRVGEERKLKEEETERNFGTNQQRPVFSLSLRGEVERLQKEHERSQKELKKAYTELNKRITEHDKCERKGMEQAKVTLQVVHDAEEVLAKAQLSAQQAADQLSQAKLTLREQSGGDAVIDCGGVRCLLKDLDDVLIKDVGGKVKQDGRWPLIVDPSGQAATFLRYRDTNYLDAMHPENMKPDTLRLALLGAIRYGKALVINMMDVDLLETVENQLNQVSPGLSSQLMSKKLLQEERYLNLVRSTDGPQYSRTEFRPDRLEAFSLVMVTKQRHPSDALLTTFYPIEIALPEKKT
ncbi:IQ motif and ankyrin repeat domain-containing protein 1-like isoform X2 [Alosa alosa]|uniref:IQ motif and ankyrin repeat domain-containing protein 1-like isoform X2 n=1 Tax=Alosa alosa TaxID=278164 RepID=UPI0020154AAA|nr:IQ motif and ankyrin repeat domain-containing protein 1-like isoform X2 [Alosa alosa]